MKCTQSMRLAASLGKHVFWGGGRASSQQPRQPVSSRHQANNKGHLQRFWSWANTRPAIKVYQEPGPL